MRTELRLSIIPTRGVAAVSRSDDTLICQCFFERFTLQNNGGVVHSTHRVSRVYAQLVTQFIS